MTKEDTEMVKAWMAAWKRSLAFDDMLARVVREMVRART